MSIVELKSSRLPELCRLRKVNVGSKDRPPWGRDPPEDSKDQKPKLPRPLRGVGLARKAPVSIHSECSSQLDPKLTSTTTVLS